MYTKTQSKLKPRLRMHCMCDRSMRVCICVRGDLFYRSLIRSDMGAARQGMNEGT